MMAFVLLLAVNLSAFAQNPRATDARMMDKKFQQVIKGYEHFFKPRVVIKDEDVFIADARTLVQDVSVTTSLMDVLLMDFSIQYYSDADCKKPIAKPDGVTKVELSPKAVVNIESQKSERTLLFTVNPQTEFYYRITMGGKQSNIGHFKYVYLA